MEKFEETKAQDAPTTSNMKFVACVVFCVIFGLLAALVVLSVMVYGIAKDIERNNKILDGNGYEQVSTADQRLFQHQNKVEKRLTFHDENTGDISNETIVINGHEEIITTSQATFIYDFSKGWVVTKLPSAVADACYVSQFDMTEDIEKVRETLLKSKSDVILKDDNTRIQYKSTGRTVSRESLSPTAAKMCENSHLIWFTDATNTGNSERALKKRRSTNGAYTVDLPDGRRQTVTYTI